jgi:hypothetical protein
MNINWKKNIWLWVAAIVAVVLYMGPSPRQILWQLSAMRQRPVAKPPTAKPQTNAAAASAQNGAVGASSESSAALNTLVGAWQGGAPLPPAGMCGLKLELRKKTGEPDRFAGYPVLGCMPLPGSLTGGSSGTQAQQILAGASPMSAVLTGTVQNGSIQFTVDKVIGKTLGGCELTSFSVTPFGTDQLVAEWQEGTCPGAHLLLKRVGK